MTRIYLDVFKLIVLDLKVVDFFAFLLYDCSGGWEGDGGVVRRFRFINNCVGDERFCCGVVLSAKIAK